MRPSLLLIAVCFLARVLPAQDPAYDSLDRAYRELRAKNYDAAVAGFTSGLKASPNRADIRKDLAYTYLKIGETDLARDQFGEAMRLDPADTHVALEYAFLCFEAQDRVSHGDAIGWKANARRIFDRVRKDGDAPSRATAEQAFQNIDAPLASGIDRWRKALAIGPPSFSAHYELAELAEQRDELDLAAEQYRAAWLLLPDRKYVLLDLGRVLLRLNRLEDGRAALLSASRGGEPRAAELARALLPDRYPHVYEFRLAIQLDSHNIELHRELAYLLLRMSEHDTLQHDLTGIAIPGNSDITPAAAEAEFRLICDSEPSDILSAAQLAFLYIARKELDRAAPLVRRVLAGDDADLANRVRAALHLPLVLQKAGTPTTITEARIMADRSLQAGYMKDALKYLKLAHDADPVDFTLILQLGSVYNMLHDDATAMRWFALARKSDDDAIDDKAVAGLAALRPSTERFRTTFWSFPVFSTRWHDLFSYAQLKIDRKLDSTVWFRPYLSLRFVGDTREKLPGDGSGSSSATTIAPQYLSESAFILAAGVASRNWHGATVWAEAGESFGYLTHHATPDYRGGVSWARSGGANIFSREHGFFWESNDDLVYIYRFDRDTLAISQNRFGYTPSTPVLQTQLFWNLNVTGDLQRQYWANFGEIGPGARFHWSGTPNALTFSVSALRGAYLINQGNPRKPNFNDVRASVWYALTR